MAGTVDHHGIQQRQAQPRQGTPTTTTVNASPATTAAGNTVSLTATVICDALPAEPTGSINFFDGPPPMPGTFLGTVPLTNTSDGMSTTAFPQTFTPTVTGPHTIYAVYDGASISCLPSVGTTTVTVTTGNPPPCTQTISGVQFGNVTTSGSLCLTPGSRVFGNVTVTGGTLNAQGAQVTGNVTVTGGTGVLVCTTSVGGNLTVTGVNGAVLIGDAGDDPGSACGGNRIAGSATLTNNTGSLEFSANQVGGNVMVNNNDTTTAATPPEPTATELEANTIRGNLGCFGNTVNGATVANNPTNDGNPNTVGGTRSGQCTGL
ncbi:Ig-like domain repeat protein [Gandjariella thermophila]|nr:Ig-like domain repeat protein [Gandjariella thermophila]